MSGLNRWQGIVRVGADPELRHTQGGTAVLSLRVACSEKYRTKDGDKETTTWINCVVWAQRGEALSKVIAKGMLLYIEGPLRISSYDDREGNKRLKVEIEVREVEILGRAKNGGDGDAGHDEPQGNGGGYQRDRAPAGQGRSGGGYQRQARPAQGPATSSTSATTDPAPDYDGGGANDADIPF